MPDEYRMTLTFTPVVRERVKRLQQEADASTITELIRRALAVYELLLEQKAAGATIFARKDGTERELLLP